METRVRRRFTVEEYLALERQSETRNEYLDGEIFEMTGASRPHSFISGSVFVALHRQLRGRPCEVHAHDMRLRVAATNLYTYPDVFVVCGEPQLDDAYADTLLNPTLIVEVLSKSTEKYDRGEKFTHYQKLASLAEYFLIAQDRVHVEHFVRQAGAEAGRSLQGMGWLFTETDRIEDELDLRSIGCTLALAEIYERVIGGASAS